MDTTATTTATTLRRVDSIKESAKLGGYVAITVLTYLGLVNGTCRLVKWCEKKIKSVPSKP